MGFCGIFKHFSGFEFFLLPSIVHARPHAGNVAVRWLMENEIELLNQTEADLLMLMQQYKSGQYCHLADCIRRVRVVRETLRHLTTACTGLAPAGAQVSEGSTGASQ